MNAHNATAAHAAIRKFRGRTVAAVLAAGAAFALTGCGAGQVSQTANQAAAINGAHAEVGAIDLRNVRIVYPGNAEDSNTEGGQARLALSIVNSGGAVSDDLISITTDLGSVDITTPDDGDTITVAPQQTVVAAGSTKKPETDAVKNSAHTEEAADPEANPAHIEITDLATDITPGLTYSVTFNFDRNGTVALEVPVDAGTETEREETDLSHSTEGLLSESGH